MKKFLIPSILGTLMFLAVTAFGDTPSKPGLLILSHGSPSPNWSSATEQLADKVRTLNEKKQTFHAVAAANMEFAQPDAAAGIKKLEEAGCGRIIVVPVFICPTGHTHFDVPASLGLYTSPVIRKTMEEENVKPATPSVPVTVTQTISEGDLLDQFVRSEIAALSEKPEEEAVLIISHGDEEHAGLIEPVMRRLLVEAVGSKGITNGDWAFCEVGQSYTRTVIPTIKQMSEKRKRILVVGLYLVASAKSIDKIGTSMGRGNRDAGAGKNPLDGIDVRFSEKGVIDHPATAAWVLNCAAEAL